MAVLPTLRCFLLAGALVPVDFFLLPLALEDGMNRESDS